MAFTWKGTKVADTRTAGVGGENMYGYAGNDSLTGSIALDQIYGGEGNDTLTGAAGNDRVNGEAGKDSLAGGAGNDKMDGGSGNDTMNGDADNDTMYGGSGLDSMDGGIGNDNMRGDSSNDTIRGGAGNDRLDGGTYNDSVEGGAGIDTIYGSFGNDTLRGESAASLDILGDKNTLYGGVGNDQLFGGVLSTNVLYGGDGNDSITGGGAADTLVGGKGNDTLSGGTGGADTVSYSTSLVGVGVNLSAATATVGTIGTVNYGTMLALRGGGVSTTGLLLASDANGDQYVTGTIENVTGSTKADWVLGDAVANVIQGLSGADTLNGGTGNDTIYGGDNGDRIVGAAADGDDLYDGGAGIDTLDLSAMTTAIVADLSLGTLTGAGTDTLESIERIMGGTGADDLTGVGSGQFNDGTPTSLLDGGAGNDTLRSATAGSGGVILQGGLGSDVYDGDDNSATDWFGVRIEAGQFDTILGFDELQNDKIYARLTDIGLTVAAATNAVAGATATIGTGTGIAIATYGTTANSTGTFNLLNIQMASDGVITVNTGSVAVAANTATATHQQFVYNQFDNGLWFDADGSGAGTATRVAQLDATNLNLNDGTPLVANVFNSTDFEFGNL